LKAKGVKVVVFADLDGSLLNDKYEYDEIEPIVRQLLSLNVSIVFVSSKTRSEIDYYRKKWQMGDPFITENGCSIVIPENYFKISYEFTKQKLGYKTIELGIDYRIIREKLAAVKNRTGANIVGFGDMTAEEITKDTDLPLYLAQLAKKREYSEPFKILDECEKEVLKAINDEGLCYTMGGRYLHISGSCEKGKATSILKKLYLLEFKRIISIGVGDSPNDLAMLKTVDKPFYVNKSADKKAIWKEIKLFAQAQ
jgi:mannosyl-3-phosphoglycerate phosphatase